jgi:hypothetical protein
MGHVWVSELLSAFEEGALFREVSIVVEDVKKNERQTNKFNYKISKFDSAV